MWIVTESTPGFLPDMEPAVFDCFEDAEAHAEMLVDELWFIHETKMERYSCCQWMTASGLNRVIEIAKEEAV